MVTTPRRKVSTPIPPDLLSAGLQRGPAPQQRARAWLWRALAVFVLAAAGAVLVWGWFKRLDPVAGFETTPVTRSDVEETVTALGKLEPRNYVDVGAQVSGQLTRILVQPGDRVAAGQLLAQIDPQVPAAKVEADQADLTRLKANLADAQAQSEYAAGEFRRQMRLQHDDATRADTVEAARRDMRSGAAHVDEVQAQIVQAESTLKADQAQLGYTRIYAPMEGTVVSVDARQGQTINANYAAPVLMRIADLATMTVWTQVSEADIPQLHPGQKLYFTTLGFGDRRWTGTLRQILPAPPKPSSRNSTSDTTGPTQPGQQAPGTVVLYTALFDVVNAAGELRPDMTAQVFFITASVQDVPTVPMAALAPQDADAGLFTARLVEGHQVVRRTVRVGIHTRFTAQVLAGLRPGDVVITGRKPGSAAPSLIGFRL